MTIPLKILTLRKSLAWEKIPTVDPLSRDFRPQDGFLSFEKVAKK